MKSLAESIVSAPRVFDEDAAAHFAESCGETFAALPGAARELLEGVAGASPYLRRLALKRKDDLAAMFAAAPSMNFART